MQITMNIDDLTSRTDIILYTPNFEKVFIVDVTLFTYVRWTFKHGGLQETNDLYISVSVSLSVS